MWRLHVWAAFLVWYDLLEVATIMRERARGGMRRSGDVWDRADDGDH